ncbi:MAG: redoxin family protein [Pyrinomonadaceae bacterium MAG19_C2-C3]|nr:redoxin family protein [Pyrinomonadaceae bacterium MAG19_C2-C3]
MKHSPTLKVIVVIAVACSILATAMTRNHAQELSLTRAQKAGAIYELPLSECKAVRLDDAFRVQPLDAAQLTARLKQQGSEPNKARPVLINFWATWCVPCREEFPDLVSIDAKYRPRGLDFFTVSVDEPELITTDVPAFLREMKATAIPAYLLNAPDPAAAIDTIDATWTGALPATFLFDKSGKLVFKHTGRIKPAELTDAINKVISESQEPEVRSQEPE